MSIFRQAVRQREQRRSPRFDVDYLAQIDFGDDAAPVSCIIGDLSARGARLTVGSRQEVPDEFVLVLRRHCRVVRRSDGQVGVEFV
jgi:PilZ domain